MSIITPNEKISEKWARSREAALTRRPLELFLQARMTEVAQQQVDKNTAMLASAATYFLMRGWILYQQCRFVHRGLTEKQSILLSKMIFAITDALATLIKKPAHAQVSAAVVVTHFFTLRQAISSAARLSVEGMVWCCVRSPDSFMDQYLEELGRQAANAVLSNGELEIGVVAETIAQLLVLPDSQATTGL